MGWTQRQARPAEPPTSPIGGSCFVHEPSARLPRRSRTIRGAGSNGTAAITWVAACRRRTRARSSDGRLSDDTSHRSSGTARPVTPHVGRGSARQPPVLRSTSRVCFRAAMSATHVLRRLSAGVDPSRIADTQTDIEPHFAGGKFLLGELLRRAGPIRWRPGSKECEVSKFSAALLLQLMFVRLLARL
jgi:hypothetical protein